MTPEQEARADIDRLLTAAGWHVCNDEAADIHAARGVAIREFKLVAGQGTADRLLYVEGKAAGVIEDTRGCVTVRFTPTRYVPPQRVAHDLTDRQRALLALLEASRTGLALRHLMAALTPGAAEWEVKEDLAFLKRLELIDSAGHGRGAYWELRRR